jgi:hypothetical protein
MEDIKTRLFRGYRNFSFSSFSYDLPDFKKTKYIREKHEIKKYFRCKSSTNGKLGNKLKKMAKISIANGTHSKF